MNKPVERSVSKAVDSIQQRLTSYASGLSYDGLSAVAIHAAKVRIIDTLGALFGGFYGEPCHIVRNLAAQMPNPGGATVIGTRMKTTLDMAAFVNGTTARFAEMNDTYHWPGSLRGHPSDVLLPILAAAEHAQVSGREFITAVVLGYEVFLRIADTVHIPGEQPYFDFTNLVCIGTAVAAGKLLGLPHDQLSHCISMAVVPNVILGQVRTGHLSMFKGVASGHAGRAGVFAALLARAGMEGPHLPFEGKAGWCDHVAGERFSLNTLGGHGTLFKVQDSMIKPRAACGTAISSILASEKVAPLKNIKDVKQVTVELYARAKESNATGEQHWNPDSRETADHSIPYIVAAVLMDGTVTPRSFNDDHLWNPELRALLEKIKIVENEEFTKAYERMPVEHRTRITVVTNSGEWLVGETGGDKDDAGAQLSDTQVVEKFRGVTEDVLGAKRVNAILDRFWHLEDMGNVAEIPPVLILG
ncbi:MAG: MmgE/PrpD family protein [Betaproteobacteria bacterium]|nr:MmgE/PrpD family protein [Betaproteobacteria bacterium]